VPRLNTNLRQLIDLGGDALGPPLAQSPTLLTQAGKRGAELAALLTQKNGFLAFEGALQVFPVGPVSEGYDLERWNSIELWRQAYGDMADDALFFAEDIFGEQFCIRDDHIHRFNPETGQSKEIAYTLREWAERILVNYSMETGYILAHTWQQQHGPLPLGARLVPPIPFVAGGNHEIDNLVAIDAVEGMLFRADIARQIRDLPDGSRIRLVIKE
jgi:hypothetical protein